MKFILKHKAVIIYLSLIVIFITSFLGLGYWYSKANLQYDLTVIGQQVGNMNYSTNSGSYLQATTPLIEGFVGTTLNLPNLNGKIIGKLTSNPGNSEKENWKLGAKQVVDEISNQGKDYYNENEFKNLNDNEKAIVALIIENKDNGKERAIQMLTHYRPVTYIGDDLGEDIGKGNALYDNTIKYNSLAPLGAAEIYTDNSYKDFRIRLNPLQKWEDGSKVTAFDYAMGISRQLSTIFASQGSYMLTEIAKIKGMDAAIKADGDSTIGSHKYNERWKLFSETEPSEHNDELNAIYYGLAPGTRTILTWDKTFLQYGLGNYKGIHFHNSEKESNIDYSYVEFNLENKTQAFVSELSSASYLPIDADWYWNNFTNEQKKSMDSFALNENSIKSNGAYKVDKFDSQYGMLLSKNENFYDKDIVPNDKFNYRMMKEPATELAMFGNNQASLIYSTDANIKMINENKEAKKWTKKKFTSPVTKYMQFNLSRARTTSAQLFLNDPNLRRAIVHTFDKNAYHKLIGINNVQPTSMFTPLNIGKTTDDADFVNLGKGLTYESGSNNETKFSNILEYANEEDRKSALNGGKINRDKDYNQDLATAYWNVFKSDMKNLGKTVPNVIKIEYLTSAGDSDPILKTLQQGISKSSFASNIKINTLKVTPAEFFPSYTRGDDFDMASIQWLPDYLDIWSMLSPMNIHDSGRSMNGTSQWTYLDGSDFTFKNGAYDTNGIPNDELARKLFNDGISQFFDGGNWNITDMNFNKKDITKVVETTDKIAFKKLANTIAEDALEDNGVYSNNVNNWFQSPDRKELTSGINRGSHVAAGDAFDDANAMLSYLLFETVTKDGAGVVVGVNETPSSVPAKTILEGDPVIGFNRFQVAVDITRINKNSMWYPVKNKLLELFNR